MKVGDLVRSVPGFGAIQYMGVVIGVEASESHVNVALTQRTTLGEATYWFPVNKLELISGGKNDRGGINRFSNG